MSLSQLVLVPMRLGYNCKMSADNNEFQKIEYLPQINSSSTSYAALPETLDMASNIAGKCQQHKSS